MTIQNIIHDRSGSVATSTFARNQYGPYERKRTTPKPGVGSIANRPKSHFNRLHVRWATRLTEAQRQGWNDYAAACVVFSVADPPVRLSGQQQFFRSNMPLVFTGLPAVHDAPVPCGQIPWTMPFNIDDSFTGFVFFELNTADPWAALPNALILIQVSPVQHSGINFYNGPWRRAGHVNTGAGGVGQFNFVSDPWVPFAAPARRWMRAYVWFAGGVVTSPRVFPFTDNV